MKKARVVLLVAMSLVLAFTMVMSGCKKSKDEAAAAATVSSIAVTGASSSITMFKTDQFTATGTMSDGTTTVLSAAWTSSDPLVATIDAATGLATGVKAGTTTITATSEEKSGTATLTVTQAYSATLYMASEGGGHMGVFPVIIDPSNTTEPISVMTGSVAKIQLQGGPSANSKIVFHDVRLDEKTNRVYYSQFLRSDATDSVTPNTGFAHIGYVDLAKDNTKATGNSVDAKLEIDATAGTAANTIAFALDNIGIVDAGSVPTGLSANTMRLLYCASGQNADYFFPMSMSFPAYIDSIPKAKIVGGTTIALTDIKRTYISQIDDAMNSAVPYPAALASTCSTTLTTEDGHTFPNFGASLGCLPLAFIHGATNADGTKMYISTNVMHGLTFATNTAGGFKFYLLDTADVISGTVNTTKVKATGSATGLTPKAAAGGSVAYRASFTPDSSKILQAGADRLLVLNGTTLAVEVDTKKDVATAGAIGGENHDVITTPDGKYAILAIRFVKAALGTGTISGVQLYDIANKKFIGGATNTCSVGTCHDSDRTAARPTCGIVGKFK